MFNQARLVLRALMVKAIRIPTLMTQASVVDQVSCFEVALLLPGAHFWLT